MGNEKMNVFERATLFAAEAACKNLGVGVVAKVVTDDMEHQKLHPEER